MTAVERCYYVPNTGRTPVKRFTLLQELGRSAELTEARSCSSAQLLPLQLLKVKDAGAGGGAAPVPGTGWNEQSTKNWRFRFLVGNFCGIWAPQELFVVLVVHVVVVEWTVTLCKARSA